MTNPHEPDLFEEFGRYKLVARFHTGAHRGWLWRDGQRMAEVEAASNTAAMAKLETVFYEMLQAKAREQGHAAHSDAATAKALLAIWSGLAPAQIAMLRAHYLAPGRALSATQLAQAAKYKTIGGVNLHYGRVGWMLFGELPRTLPLDKSTGKPVYTFALAEGPVEPRPKAEHWIWTMRPEVARGLEIAELVAS
jgi:hypothetical protein